MLIQHIELQGSHKTHELKIVSLKSVLNFSQMDFSH